MIAIRGLSFSGSLIYILTPALSQPALAGAIGAHEIEDRKSVV